MAVSVYSNRSIVYTNENCVGCNKCVNVCNCIGACVPTEMAENGRFRIMVNGDRCMSCGACFDACDHNAREFLDGTSRFFGDLQNVVPISVLVAPSFMSC